MLFFLLIVSFYTTIIAQKVEKIEELYSIKEKTFRLAMKYNDLEVAKFALFEMMVLKPELVNLKDSLNILYFNLGNYRENIILSNELLENTKSPSYATNLEIRAIAYQNLGQIKESLEDYEKLYALTKNIYYLYQIASLQYELKRYGECNETISKILDLNEAEKTKITITIDNRMQQKVSLKAAVLNMRGVLALETNQYEVAKKNFKEALSLEKDFILAYNNLQLVEMKQKQENTSRFKKKQ
jgi:tetratricopeptide (TPR) repeat protein